MQESAILNNIKNSDGKPVLLKMVAAVQKNKDYLNEIDGIIGNGDHGINMNKGFSIFGDQIMDKKIGFTDGLYDLGFILFTKTGKSMGPIYGTIFMSMSEAGGEYEEIDLKTFSLILSGGLEALQDVIKATVGDKTLIDTLSPANDAIQKAVREGKNFAEALQMMKAAAIKGMDSTRELAAHYGRSSRQGNHSRGVLDVGAVSCCIILCAIADGILELLA